MWEVDEGDYACVAANDAGQATSVAHVKIGNPPRITQMHSALYLPEGDNTKIKIDEISLSFPRKTYVLRQKVLNILGVFCYQGG